MKPITEETFRSRLAAKIRKTGTSLAVGVDPHLSGDGADFFAAEFRRLGAREFLRRWASILVDVAADVAPAIKFQSAFFEAHGEEGFGAMREALGRARAKGLITILDAKRGDIASTMAAYGRMAFDWAGADALTVTPYMGFDVVSPLLPWLKRGRGIYVVWVSSNPSGAGVQELPIDSQRAPGAGDSVAEVLLRDLVSRCQEAGVASGLGLVLGATKAGFLTPQWRERLTGIPLLLPGIGAQGATLDADAELWLRTAGHNLLPQSRGLYGPADLTTSWDDFAAEVRVRTERAAAAASLLGAPIV